MLSSARLFETSQSQLDHSRLMALINSLTEGFLAITQQGVIELSNGVALNLLDTNSLVGKNVKDAMPLINGEQQSFNLINLVPRTGPGINSRDYRLKYADGSIINLHINISAVRQGFGGKDKGGFVVLFRDITAEKSAEEEREEFISVTSHELRNPVAIAEGSISNAILLSEKAKLAGSLPQILKSAHEQIVFLSNLINDLAMVSRADHNRLDREAKEYDVVEIVKLLQADYAAQAQKKGLEIKTELEDVPKLFGSKLYTREILQNLVTNAIKYSDSGIIAIKTAKGQNGVVISVTDNGYGIDPQEQKKIFTKFYRSDDSRVRKVNGTGLGLYVSAKLATLMGGSLGMVSGINQGSVFSLSLPYSIKAGAAKKAPTGVA